MEGEAMSLFNPKPIQDFTTEEQKIIDQICECGWNVKVYQLPDESWYHVSCHFRFPPDRIIDVDLPITTRGQTKTEALEIALVQTAINARPGR